MLLRIIEETDNVTKTFEEHIEEYDNIEFELINEGDKRFLSIKGKENLKDVNIVLDFTGDETEEILKKIPEITNK